MSSASQQQPSAAIPGRCPTPEELGNAGWSVLHSSAAVYPYHPTRRQRQQMTAFLEGWSHFYACRWCAFHLRQWMAAHPPRVGDKLELSRYVCEMHNEVNERTGKDVYDCDPVAVLRRWHPGFPDKMGDRPPLEEEMKEMLKEERQRRRAEAKARDGGKSWGLWTTFLSPFSSSSSSSSSSAAGKSEGAGQQQSGAPAANVERPKDGAAVNAWRTADKVGGAGGSGGGASPAGGGGGKVADDETDVEAVLRRLKTCQVYCPENEQQQPPKH